MIIKNREALLAPGSNRARRVALEIIDQALTDIDASRIIRRRVSRDRDRLWIDSESINLGEYKDIYVLGAGKGVIQLAEGLEQIIGPRIKEGIIVEKRCEGMEEAIERIAGLRYFRVHQGEHPVPDQAAVEGARDLVRVAKRAGKNDLVFFCVTGGATCLTTLPAAGLDFSDIQAATEILLAAGIEISIVNAVRTAITQLSGGRLARFVSPARIINFVVNDYVPPPSLLSAADRYAPGWGPTVPVADSKYIDIDAVIRILEERALWGRLPEAVRRHLHTRDPSCNPFRYEDFCRLGLKVQTYVIADPQDVAEAAKRAAEQLHLNCSIITSSLEGEAREVGLVLAAIAKEISRNQRPLIPPGAAVFAGETTVSLRGKHGLGGRNQECVLSAATKIEGIGEIAIVSVGTDGTDGPTAVAGGIVDGSTVARAKEAGISILKSLDDHASTEALCTLEDAIYFWEPGNNVCDLALVVVIPE